MKIYHYDHCPYCAKARMIFGFKDIKIEEVILLNDDEATPTEMIGQKMVPILEIDNEVKESKYLPESMDIIKYVDQNYGDGEIVSYSSASSEIADWIYSARNFAYELAMPRWVQMPLEEFKTDSARNYFQKKKESKNIGSFAEALRKTPELIKKAESELKYLENLMLDNGRFYQENLHIDDFHLFASLRGLTTTRGINWPTKLRKYVENISKRSKVNTFCSMAI